LGSGTFILKPRSYVIVGSLNELTGDSGGPVPDKFRSFELFRRTRRGNRIPDAFVVKTKTSPVYDAGAT
jgi:hypothetical protein